MSQSMIGPAAAGMDAPGLATAVAHRLSGPVLIAGDETASSAGALRIGELLARRDRVNAHVLGVVRPLDASVWRLVDVDPETIETGRRIKHLEALRQRVYQTVGRSALFSVEVESGSPATVLARAAGDRASACILVGLDEREAAGRAATEDAALEVARRASVPVLAVPASAGRLPVRALVAADFGESSHGAARLAMQLLAEGSTLTLVHVEPETELRSLGDTELAGRYERGAAALLGDEADVLASAGGVGIETRVLASDDAPAALLAMAADGAYDLVACGTQSATASEPRTTGSVSTALLRGARSMVLMAPRAGPVATGGPGEQRESHVRRVPARQAHDRVAGASADSFPASDAPSWTELRLGPPARDAHQTREER